MKSSSFTTALLSGASPSRRELLQLVITLSLPAILAQLSSVAMQYIDATMVGSLGAGATASIGLVASTTWLFNGLCVSSATGFSVQCAQLIGAGRQAEARNVLRQSLIVLSVFGMLLGLVGAAISSSLPIWLGGAADVCAGASSYFFIFSCALPASQLRQLASGMMQCSGDMRTPSILNSVLCLLDVVFNSILIFPTRRLSLPGISVLIPGAGMGVAGAALGTALAEYVTTALMLWFLCLRSPSMGLTQKGSWRLSRDCIGTAARLAVPIAAERAVLSCAQIASTRIVSPLGTVAVAANSLSVTAESLCYMPGYGISAAATTMVGQSIGAGRKDLARSSARLSVALGVAVMSCTGILLYLFAPFMFAFLTPDPAVRALGARVLRIEAFAEPLFAASIVAAGALRGAGDTLIPSILNLVSIWGVRITAAYLLAPHLGLIGVWAAMCGELCFRGVLFLVRLWREKWLERGDLYSSTNQSTFK